MSNYINLQTLIVKSEHEIRADNPNTSYALPFTPDGYEIILSTPQPIYDIYSEYIELSTPVKNSNGDWEQTWSIIQLTGDTLIDAQAQKVEDEKAKIKADIAALEASITPRRQREAILAIDTTWLADVELQISQLRQQLASN